MTSNAHAAAAMPLEAIFSSTSIFNAAHSGPLIFRFGDLPEELQSRVVGFCDSSTRLNLSYTSKHAYQRHQLAPVLTLYETDCMRLNAAFYDLDVKGLWQKQLLLLSAHVRLLRRLEESTEHGEITYEIGLPYDIPSLEYGDVPDFAFATLTRIAPLRAAREWKSLCLRIDFGDCVGGQAIYLSPVLSDLLTRIIPYQIGVKLLDLPSVDYHTPHDAPLNLLFYDIEALRDFLHSIHGTVPAARLEAVSDIVVALGADIESDDESDAEDERAAQEMLDISTLTHLINLKSLTIWRQDISLQSLPTNLTTLELHAVYISGRIVLPKHLAHLTLSKCTGTPFYLASLPVSLINFVVSRTRLIGSSFRQCVNLRLLNIYEPVDQDWPDHIQRQVCAHHETYLRNLNAPHLSCIDIETGPYFNWHSTTVRHPAAVLHLHISSCDTTRLDLESLCNLRSLAIIGRPELVPFPGLSSIILMSSLQTLGLTFVNFGPSIRSKQLPSSLKELRLGHCHVQHFDLAASANLTKLFLIYGLPYIRIDECILPPNLRRYIQLCDAPSLPPVNNLQSLRIVKVRKIQGALPITRLQMAHLKSIACEIVTDDL